MTNYKSQQEIEKEFDEEFAADKIWVVPSKDNYQTINEIKSFIRQIRQDDIKSLIEWAEKEKSNNPAYVCYVDVNRVLSRLQSQLKELN